MLRGIDVFYVRTPANTRFTTISSATGSADLHLASKCVEVAGLQVHSPRSLELAGKAFFRAPCGEYTSRGDSPNVVVTVPGNQMTVIDDVLLLVSEL